ncbi:tetratricopeptide repeat protein [Treponema primitia]|uniref:tetratricopeptide repeat protein n=1 Tax=Treponema primitia TaxID=88058 RepID=UPI00397FA23A
MEELRMFSGKKAFLALVFLYMSFGGVYGQSSFTQGEEQFLRNKPQDALVFLEAAVAETPENTRAFLYLGLAYQQLNRLDEAIIIFRRVLPQADTDTALIAYNLGNVYYAKGNISVAEDFYTQALEANPGYASAYLNRANAKLTRQALQDAVYDYEAYLNLEPGSAKRSRIEQLLSAIRSDFAAAERQRIIEEAKAAAEAERKKRILDEVTASLQSAAEDTKGLSSGSEDVLGYEGEFELE